MGSLTLPASAIIYIDTSPVIYSVEKHADYWELLRPLWEASKAGRVEVVSSELTLLETLVGPLKQGDYELGEGVRESTDVDRNKIVTDYDGCFEVCRAFAGRNEPQDSRRNTRRERSSSRFHLIHHE